MGNLLKWELLERLQDDRALIEHLSQNQVDNYCERKLSAADLLSVSGHLEECDPCRQRIEASLKGDTVFVALRSEIFSEPSEVSHATAEQTAAYVDGTLAGDELRMVEDHLTRCEHCIRSIDDLQAFKNQIAQHLDTEYHPASVIARPAKRRFADYLPSFTVRYPTFAIGAAFTLILIAVTGWVVWRTTREEVIKPDIALSPPPIPTDQPPTPNQEPVIARLNDFDGQVTLSQAGQLSGVDRMSPAYREVLREALTKQRIEPSPLLKGLVRPPSSLMSDDKEKSGFSVIEPVGKVLLTDRPQFRWSPLAGATNYVVEIYDSELTLVTASSELTAHSWEPPKSLARARVYSWQVKAITGEKITVSPRPPAPQARFRILDGATANELSQARRDYSSSHLLLGLLYAKAGLLDDARQEFHVLQTANPDSEIVRKLLANLTAPRR